MDRVIRVIEKFRIASRAETIAASLGRYAATVFALTAYLPNLPLLAVECRFLAAAPPLPYIFLVQIYRTLVSKWKKIIIS